VADVAGTEAEERAELLLLVANVARLGVLIVGGAVALAALVVGRQFTLWGWMLGLAAALAIGALVPARWVRRLLGHGAAVAAVVTAASWPTSGSMVALAWGPTFALIAAALFVMASAVPRPGPGRPERRLASVAGDLLLVLLVGALVVALATSMSREGVLWSGQVSCGSLVSPEAPPPVWADGCGLLHRQQKTDALAAIGLATLTAGWLGARIRNRRRQQPAPLWLACEVRAP
jgi:hypothetical protein